jgi:putative membrane protein
MKRYHLVATAFLAATLTRPVVAQADLNDLEMAHVAVTASNIDIRYAHLALALSANESVRAFAETMIRDHTAVNAQVADLARRLNVQAQDNPLSQQLLRDAERLRDELSRLRGEAFDRRYVENELNYHRAVNGIVADSFVPNIENADVKKAFEGALVIFRGHERHAAQLARTVQGRE